jgi:DNA-binding NarL/FixJ family response regulator
LDAYSTDRPGHYHSAIAAFARARVIAAMGDDDPSPHFRRAITDFRRGQMPLEAARARLDLAAALAMDRPEVALAEARAALAVFEQLHADRFVDAAAALLRSLGIRPTTAVKLDGLRTKREAEVLKLLGHGLSNPEISERLFISRKTVEYHIGNILAKLGLRTRAQAAAYAARQDQAANGGVH